MVNSKHSGRRTDILISETTLKLPQGNVANTSLTAGETVARLISQLHGRVSERMNDRLCFSYPCCTAAVTVMWLNILKYVMDAACNL